jgi:hypothetical protein
LNGWEDKNLTQSRQVAKKGVKSFVPPLLGNKNYLCQMDSEEEISLRET